MPFPGYAPDLAFGQPAGGIGGATARAGGRGRMPGWPVIAAVGGATVVVAAFIVVVLQGQSGQAGGAGHSASPSVASTKATHGSSATHGQAVKINQILDESKPSRGKLRQALSQVLRCSNTGQALSSMQRVADQRAQQLTQAKKLKVDALDDGAELKQHLVDALSASYRADEAYLKWAKRYEAHGCKGKTAGDSAYDAGNAASEEATKAKSGFVAKWNAIAKQEDLPHRGVDEI